MLKGCRPTTAKPGNRAVMPAPKGAPGWPTATPCRTHLRAILRKDAAEGDPVSNAIALFIRPDGAERCTAWFAMATLGDPADDEELRSFQDTVFAHDRPVVKSQQPK